MRSLVYMVNVSLLQTLKCSAGPRLRGQGPERKRLLAPRNRCPDNSASPWLSYRATSLHVFKSEFGSDWRNNPLQRPVQRVSLIQQCALYPER